MSDSSQHVQFCTAADGTRLAYAIEGTGPPLMRTANWVSHLEHEWRNEVRRPTLEALTRQFTLLRYDQRGCGLSDWNVQDMSFESWVEDLGYRGRRNLPAALHSLRLLARVCRRDRVRCALS